ncbi:hypothetical protein [Rhizobium sp. RU35A]|uniref:hypothetical protein n=1 Tax=Rhizobium sp. RU35A TaxID=1907414 RepID=UPI00122C2410|nr:hypothetical protein [Rhizobium sp. RU35A]
MEPHSFPSDLVDIVAKAIFDQDETFNLEAIARLDAQGNRTLGDTIGRERDSWDNRRNRPIHDGYRRRAVAALKAAQICGVVLPSINPYVPQPKSKAERKAGAV